MSPTDRPTGGIKMQRARRRGGGEEWRARDGKLIVAGASLVPGRLKVINQAGDDGMLATAALPAVPVPPTSINWSEALYTRSRIY